MKNPKWGHYVENSRKEHGLNRRTLAAKAGIDPSYVTVIESAGFVPKQHVIVRIAAAMELDVNEVMLAAGYAPPNLELYSAESETLANVMNRINTLSVGDERPKVNRQRRSSKNVDIALTEPSQQPVDIDNNMTETEVESEAEDDQGNAETEPEVEEEAVSFREYSY